MEDINKVKSISLWIFIVPFVAVNACLILITQFHSLFPNQENVILNTIPYIDGGTSISRTARVFPTYWIFKPVSFKIIQWNLALSTDSVRTSGSS